MRARPARRAPCAKGRGSVREHVEVSRPTPHVQIDPRRPRAQHRTRCSRPRAAAGLALRPHAKTHKSLEVARLQLAAGAVGLTVATVAEAEVFAEVCDDLFIAYPLWVDDERAARLRGVLARARVVVGVDSVESVRQRRAARGRRAAGAGRGRQRPPPQRRRLPATPRGVARPPSRPAWPSTASSPSPATPTPPTPARPRAEDEQRGWPPPGTPSSAPGSRARSSAAARRRRSSSRDGGC